METQLLEWLNRKFGADTITRGAHANGVYWIDGKPISYKSDGNPSTTKYRIASSFSWEQPDKDKRPARMLTVIIANGAFPEYSVRVPTDAFEGEDKGLDALAKASPPDEVFHESSWRFIAASSAYPERFPKYDGDYYSDASGSYHLGRRLANFQAEITSEEKNPCVAVQHLCYL